MMAKGRKAKMSMRVLFIIVLLVLLFFLLILFYKAANDLITDMILKPVFKIG